MNEVVRGWWHGHDVESAVAMLNDDFGPLGAPAITEAELTAVMVGVNDEGDEDVRRHQIGWMARRANAALAAAGRDERVRAFALDESDDDSGWYLVTASEHAAAIAQRGAPEDIEAQWDDESIADPQQLPSAAPARSTNDHYAVVVRTWWAYDDRATAIRVLNETFATFGAPPTSEVDLFKNELCGIERKDKPHMRRFQIGWMARRINMALAAARRTERLRAFAGGDSVESGWRLINPHDFTSVRAELGAPENIERVWDDTRITNPLGVLRITPSPTAKKFDGESIAAQAIREHDFVLGARAAQAWVDDGDVLLGPITLMECLVTLARHDDAKPTWTKTAQRWLRGFQYKIYRRQWDRLLAIHTSLQLPQDGLLAQCRAARDSSPATS